jgi:hypothetical protein
MCDDLKKKHEEVMNALKAEKSKSDGLLKSVDDLRREKDSLKNDVVDLKGRSMRDNLLFYNIDEEKDREARKKENCTEKVLKFCVDKIGIIDAYRYKIDRAHRVGSHEHGKIRPIVAKFNFHQEKMEVKEKARLKLSGTDDGVSDQYPQEIRERRQKLIPSGEKIK